MTSERLKSLEKDYISAANGFRRCTWTHRVARDVSSIVLPNGCIYPWRNITADAKGFWGDEQAEQVGARQFSSVMNYLHSRFDVTVDGENYAPILATFIDVNREAIAYAKLVVDTANLAFAHGEQAYFATLKGNYDLAISEVLQAVELEKSVGDTDQRCLVWDRFSQTIEWFFAPETRSVDIRNFSDSRKERAISEQ